MPRYFADGFEPVEAPTDDIAAANFGTQLAQAAFGPNGYCRVRERIGAKSIRAIAYEVLITSDWNRQPPEQVRTAEISFVEVCANEG